MLYLFRYCLSPVVIVTTHIFFISFAGRDVKYDFPFLNLKSLDVPIILNIKNKSYQIKNMCQI